MHGKGDRKLNRILIIVLLIISMSFGMVNSEIPILEYDYPDIIENAVHHNSWGDRTNQHLDPLSEEEKYDLFWDWCYVGNGAHQRLKTECVEIMIDAQLQPLEDRLDLLEESEK